MTAPAVLFAPLRDDCYAVGLARRPAWLYLRSDFVVAFELLRERSEHRGAWRHMPHGKADPTVYRRSLCNRLQRARGVIRNVSPILADELEFETRVAESQVYMRVVQGDRRIDTEPLAGRSVTRLGLFLMRQ